MEIRRAKKVVGYDANALYLWAIGQEMPEGMFVTRKSENDFRPQIRDKYMQSFNWFTYLNQYEGKRILHQRNNGKESDSTLPGRRFDSKENTVYQFHGCYHHGHECVLTNHVTSRKWHKTKEHLAARTQKITDFLRSKGIQSSRCENVFFRHCSEIASVCTISLTRADPVSVKSIEEKSPKRKY